MKHINLNWDICLLLSSFNRTATTRRSGHACPDYHHQNTTEGQAQRWLGRAPLKMKRIIALCAIVISFVSFSQDDNWEQLFNGKDLSGWSVICKPQDKDKVFWTVDNGAILCNSIGNKDHNKVWLISDREFSDFELRLKFQAYSDSPGNSGVQFRCHYDYNTRGGMLHGPQVDINPPAPIQWRTGLIFDETLGENRWVSPNLPSWEMPLEHEPEKHIFKYAEDGDGWNELIIICKGMKIKTIVNGIVRTDWDATGHLDNELHKKYNVGTSGHFAFQLNSGDELRIRYKDIIIKEL